MSDATPKNNNHWSSSDVALLVILLGRHEMDEVARRLGRTECAVLNYMRLNEMGVSQVVCKRDGLLDRHDAAKMLGIAAVTLSKWVLVDDLPTVKVPGLKRQLYSMREVKKWLQSRPMRADVLTLPVRTRLGLSSDSRLLAAKDVARRLRVNPGTVRRWQSLGLPSSEGLGCCRVYKLAEVVRWLRGQPRTLAYLSPAIIAEFHLKAREVAHAG